MLTYIYKHFITGEQKLSLKRKYHRAQKLISDTFFSYNREDLKNALSGLGVKEGDTLWVHSSFNSLRGFQGTPLDIVNCLIELLGESGNLLMPSMSYMTSCYEYLRKNEVFNVKKTPSRMGLLSELFRRKNGVLRSLNSAHPILAFGKDAAWLVEGHEKCMYSCGKDTPFDKFRSLNGKVLFFDVPFIVFTFLHYIEDLYKNEVPFQLYRKEPMAARLLDYEGKERIVNTYVFSDVAVRGRRTSIFKKTLLKKKMLRKMKIGRTTLMLVTAADAVQCIYEMKAGNASFHTCFYAGVGNHE